MPAGIEETESAVRPSEQLEDDAPQAAELEGEAAEFITRHVLENDATFFDG